MAFVEKERRTLLWLESRHVTAENHGGTIFTVTLTNKQK